MRKSTLAVVILASLMIGCEKKEEAAPATPAAPAPRVEAPATPTAADAKNAAQTSTTSPAASAAEEKLAQVTQYIKDKKYDLADKLLKELEDNKTSLPQSVQDQLGTARTSLTAAKAASGDVGGLKLPGSK